MDVLFINPGNSKGIYQGLSNQYSAIEPPTWALLLAESVRKNGFHVGILDCNAEQLSHPHILERIEKIKPRLICFVVYGQNVNAGTTNMSGTTALSNFIKKNSSINYTISIIGSYVQSLPLKCLQDEKSIDIVFTNEGVYALKNLLRLTNFNSKLLFDVKGIAFRDNNEIKMTLPEKIVPQDKMDEDLPGYAWDLLPKKQKPFDLYRSPLWHSMYDENKRSPYAALQTSLGCQFGCSFCMINIINRDDNDPVGVASNYSKMRYWSPEFIIKEFDKLISLGVKTIRIVDEMFLLNPKYYIPLCEMLSDRNKNDDLIMWAYSRIDTIRRPGILDLVRKAGIRWLCLGIESGNREIRLEVSKGKFQDVDVNTIIKQVHESDIEVMANYIYGLPGDDKKSMQKTFDLSIELCTSGWNTYTAMALPGSKLYKEAIEKNIKLPDDYEGYSFHSYNIQPLPTDSLSPEEILKFRDESFLNYHTNNNFLKRINAKYGKKAVENILAMTKVKLKRKILGDTL